jgi:hypothetical protein
MSLALEPPEAKTVTLYQEVPMFRKQTSFSLRRQIILVIIGALLAMFTALPIMADGFGTIDPPAKCAISPDTYSATILLVETSLLLTSSIL